MRKWTNTSPGRSRPGLMAALCAPRVRLVERSVRARLCAFLEVERAARETRVAVRACQQDAAGPSDTERAQHELHVVLWGRGAFECDPRRVPPEPAAARPAVAALSAGAPWAGFGLRIRVVVAGLSAIASGAARLAV